VCSLIDCNPHGAGTAQAALRTGRTVSAAAAAAAAALAATAAAEDAEADARARLLESSETDSLARGGATSEIGTEEAAGEEEEEAVAPIAVGGGEHPDDDVDAAGEAGAASGENAAVGDIGGESPRAWLAVPPAVTEDDVSIAEGLSSTTAAAAPEEDDDELLELGIHLLSIARADLQGGRGLPSVSRTDRVSAATSRTVASSAEAPPTKTRGKASSSFASLGGGATTATTSRNAASTTSKEAVSLSRSTVADRGGLTTTNECERFSKMARE